MSKKKITELRHYRSYMFKDKDPAIDIVRKIVPSNGTYMHIAEKSGVSQSTMRNWFRGKTKRPQFATLQAVARAMGHSFEITRKK